MRNLRTAGVETRLLEDKLQLAACDSSRCQLIFSTASGSLVSISLNSKQVCWRLPLHTDMHDDVLDKIVGLEFLLDNEILVVGTQSGELLSVSLSTQTIEVVGNFEGGIVQMSSSPDGELLAIATGLGMLIVMTPDWEVFYEIPLDESSAFEGESSQGKLETDQLRITWRADGKYFATLSGDANTKHVRVWERDTGTLHSKSKEFSSTASVLDWVPSGARLSSVCSTNKTEKGEHVIFFERNGLERGFFNINGPDDALVSRVKWNSNSELFAVLLRYRDWDAIQVWSFSNYHWYLKQEWRHPKEHKVDFTWDPENPFYLFTWTISGQVQLTTLCWDNAIVCGDSLAMVIDGPSLLVTPLALAVVPPPMCFFKLKFKSPVQVVSVIQSEGDGYLVAASLSGGAISLLSLPAMKVWDALEDLEVLVPNEEFLVHTEAFLSMRLLGWLDSSTFLGVVSMTSGNVNSSSLSHEILMEFQVFPEEEKNVDKSGLCRLNWSLKLSNQIPVDKRVMSITKHPLKSQLLVHFEDGSIWSYACGRGLVREDRTSLVPPCVWIQAHSAPSSEQVVIIASDVNGRLLVDSNVLSKESTSFVVHSASINGKKIVHVLYTTKRDVLHIVNLQEVLGVEQHTETSQDISDISQKYTNDPVTLGNSYKKQGNSFLKSRTVWERGARLVSAIGESGASVIVQTVRGNLETVFPRNLVLGSIVAALCDFKFNEAILLARRHHINLNLLVDFRGWEDFVQFSNEFVKQVKNLSHVTELVCAVSAGNATDNTYRDSLLPYMKGIVYLKNEHVAVASSQSSSGSTKIRSIMHAIRDALQNEVAPSPKRELCILTTMARSDPPELEKALQQIKKMREEEIDHVMQSAVEMESKRLSAEEALKHLLWLSDSRAVFNAALGLYDLHLAAMVAANSQGDPKEFLPLLEDLEKMSPPIMRYTIDLQLQRFESALKNLAAAGSSHFSKCLELVKQNPQLFPQAKHLFQTGSERAQVLEAWGDQLLAEKKFEEAAAAFSSCSQLQKALVAYRAGGFWENVLVVASLLAFSPEDVLKLAHELRDESQAMGRPAEAAKIALDYCKDPEDAVHLYVEAHEWIQSVRVAFCFGKGHLVKDVIEPAALECSSSYMVEFEEGSEKIGKYLARYIAVKQRRLLLEMKLKTESMEDVEDDAASDVSSHVSGMSAYTTGSTLSSKYTTNNSSKSHKQSRGKSRGGKIRAGSPGEEAALVEHMKGMDFTPGTIEEIKRLLEILVLLGHNPVAEKLQSLAVQFQTSLHKALLEADSSSGNEQVQRLAWRMEILDVLKSS